MTIDVLDVEQIIVKARQLSPEKRVQIIQRLAETLVSQPSTDAPQFLEYGKYKGENMSTEEDFKIAEWHLSDEEFDEP